MSHIPKPDEGREVPDDSHVRAIHAVLEKAKADSEGHISKTYKLKDGAEAWVRWNPDFPEKAYVVVAYDPATRWSDADGQRLKPGNTNEIWIFNGTTGNWTSEPARPARQLEHVLAEMMTSATAVNQTIEGIASETGGKINVD